MKKSKKIIAIVVAAIILFVAIGLTLYFCLWHNKQNAPEVGDGDNQGNFTYSTPSGLGMQVSKTDLTVGDTFTVTLEASTTRTNMYWFAIDFVIGPMLNEDTGVLSVDMAKNFELVNYSLSAPFNVRKEWMDSSGAHFDSSRGTAGFRVSLAYIGDQRVVSTQKLTIVLELKVKDTAVPIESFKFGVAEKDSNSLSFISEDYKTRASDYANGTSKVNDNTTANSGFQLQTVGMSIKAKNN